MAVSRLTRFAIRFGRTSPGLWATRLALVALLLLAWESAAEGGAVNTFIFSRPTAIGLSLIGWLRTGVVWRAAAETGIEALTGYVLGLIVGAVLAALFAFVPLVARIYLPFVAAANAVPRLALAPLFVAWLGFDRPSKVALVVVVVMFLNFFTLYAGFLETQADFVDGARLLGAGRVHVWTHVHLPSLLRRILVSLRTSLGFALGAAIVGEFVGASAGLGYLIAYAMNLFRASQVFAGILITIVLVAVVNIVLDRIEQRYLAWAR